MMTNGVNGFEHRFGLGAFSIHRIDHLHHTRRIFGVVGSVTVRNTTHGTEKAAKAVATVMAEARRATC
jgi:hypothetical protein